MMIKVELFAAARQICNGQQLIISFDDQANVSVAQLRRAISAEYPQVADLLARARFAVNQQFATDGQKVTEDCEVAIIPPVSGG